MPWHLQRATSGSCPSWACRWGRGQWERLTWRSRSSPLIPVDMSCSSTRLPVATSCARSAGGASPWGAPRTDARAAASSLARHATGGRRRAGATSSAPPCPPPRKTGSKGAPGPTRPCACWPATRRGASTSHQCSTLVFSWVRRGTSPSATPGEAGTGSCCQWLIHTITTSAPPSSIRRCLAARRPKRRTCVFTRLARRSWRRWTATGPSAGGPAEPPRRRTASPYSSSGAPGRRTPGPATSTPGPTRRGPRRTRGSGTSWAWCSASWARSRRRGSCTDRP
mmetsp:Transcript_32733/g.97422  ORF Transcript_32733/g.97422 Transcript_32733/m.97422 type:complete len:281 (+) Transcript_32733:580-1422(+)